MRKSYKIIASILVFVALIVSFSIYNNAKKEEAAENDRKMRAMNSFENYKKTLKIRENYLNFLLFQEKLKILSEKEKAIDEFVKENTRYVKKANPEILDDDFNEINYSLRKGDSVLSISTKETEGIQYDLIKIGYDDEPVGWMKAEDLTDSRNFFIDIVYDDVDYGIFEKTDGYKNNPMIKVRGIYVTGHKAAGSIDSLIELAKRTDINTFVIDFKDDNENMLFFSEAAEKNSPKANNRVYIKDPESFMKKLKDNNIYLIARIVTFKSPRYALAHPEKSIVYKGSGAIFKTGDGISWSSPYDRDLWKYNVDIGKEAASYGFNEIQFDYVRFPATGSKKDKILDFRNYEDENKTEAIQNFLKYAYGELSQHEVYVAADIFGWTATAINDVGIGQHWEAISGVVDYMCPMMYPSHYGPGIFGLAVPDAHPYTTIDRSIKDAIARNQNIEAPGKLRPWIQDFTATWVKGYIKYGTKEVEDQIRALKDNGVDEYILWNPMNRYSENALRGDENE